MKIVECLRCRAPMESGFIADNTHGGLAQENWTPGQPQRSFWFGLKIDADQSIPVRTFRCPNCGYLESYARAQPESD
jgi:hypothetical protein